MRWRSRRAVSGRMCQTRRSASSTSALVTSRTAMRPSRGKACCSRLESHWRACRGCRQPGRLSCHTCSAASAKVGTSAARRRSSRGSPPALADLRLALARARASVSETSGKPPRPELAPSPADDHALHPAARPGGFDRQVERIAVAVAAGSGHAAREGERERVRRMLALPFAVESAFPFRHVSSSLRTCLAAAQAASPSKPVGAAIAGAIPRRRPYCRRIPAPRTVLSLVCASQDAPWRPERALTPAPAAADHAARGCRPGNGALVRVRECAGRARAGGSVIRHAPPPRAVGALAVAVVETAFEAALVARPGGADRAAPAGDAAGERAVGVAAVARRADTEREAARAAGSLAERLVHGVGARRASREAAPAARIVAREGLGVCGAGAWRPRPARREPGGRALGGGLPYSLPHSERDRWHFHLRIRQNRVLQHLSVMVLGRFARLPCRSGAARARSRPPRAAGPHGPSATRRPR